MPPQTDASLIAASRAGSLEAFEILYERYKNHVFRTALAITHDQHAAEDVLQECFIRLHRHLGRLDVRLSLAAWLYRVTVNLSCDWVTRRQRWWQPLEDVIEGLSLPAQLSPAQLVERREMEAAVQQAMGTLKLDHRVTLVLYYVNGLSVEEIAAVMGCPVGTVKSRLHYGRKSLRRKLVGAGWIPREVGYELS